MSGYTPGPWRVEKGAGHIFIRANAIKGHDGIAKIIPHQAEQNAPNAALIAAAPLLVEALQRIAHSREWYTHEQAEAIARTALRAAGVEA